MSMNQEEIQKLAKELIDQGGALMAQYESIEKMYFMDEGEVGSIQRPRQDAADVKLTISPSVRNTVIGLVRLLTTNVPHFKAKSPSGQGKLDEIEKLCEQVWRESCEAKQAALHVDLVRSAALYSDCHLAADAVADLVAVAGDDERTRLEDIGTRTPYLLEVRSPRESYLYFGRYGLRGVLRRYQTRGDDVKATYKTSMSIGNNEQVWVDDWMDMTNRMVWVESKPQEPLVPLTAHGLKELLFGAKIADGSELWREMDRRRAPFLYSMWKGQLWRRQCLVLTEIFTALNERGTAPLFGFEEQPSEVKVEFVGPGIRYINAAKPRLLSEAAYDPNLVALLREVLDPLTESSTIFPQTLGSAEGIGDAPFSSIAMLSQSGQLPTVPIKDSVAAVIKKVMLAMVRRIKSNPPPTGLKGIVDLKPADIPEDLDLEVTLEIKLPQDAFKNVQVALAGIQAGLITKEWAQEHLLQIQDATSMRRNIWFENGAEALFKEKLTSFIMQLRGKLAATPQGPGGGPQTGKPPEPPGGQGMAPEAMMQAAGGETPGQGVTFPGGAEAAQAGGGALPATGPMAPAGTNPPEGL